MNRLRVRQPGHRALLHLAVSRLRPVLGQRFQQTSSSPASKRRDFCRGRLNPLHLLPPFTGLPVLVRCRRLLLVG